MLSCAFPLWRARAALSGLSLVLLLAACGGGSSGGTTASATDCNAGVTTSDAVGVDAGEDLSVTAGAPVSLHASGHAGAGGLSFCWQQTEGPTVSLDNADTSNPTFTAPDQSATLAFLVQAVDGSGGRASDTVQVLVQAAPAPTIDTDGGIASSPGDVTTLKAFVSGGLPSGASVNWTQTGGTAVSLAGAQTLTPSFIAPPAANLSELEFEVTLTTASGSKAASRARVWVYPDTLLAVDAGADRQVHAGGVVTLAGKILAGGDDQTVYVWRQTAGRPAVVDSPNALVTLVRLPGIPVAPDAFGDLLEF